MNGFSNVKYSASLRYINVSLHDLREKTWARPSRENIKKGAMESRYQMSEDKAAVQHILVGRESQRSVAVYELLRVDRPGFHIES